MITMPMSKHTMQGTAGTVKAMAMSMATSNAAVSRR